MKAKDLARYIMTLPEEMQELDVIVLESGYEYEEGIGELEAGKYEIYGSWNRELRCYEKIEGLRFSIKEPEKPIQGEVVGNNELSS